MKIAIIGGTGDIGEGLALRLAQHNEVIVGSREAAKAIEAADNYNKLLKSRGMKDEIKGMSNEEAAKSADVVIMAVRYQFAIPTIQALNNAGALDGKIVVTPIVPMSKGKLCAFTPPACGSATKECCAVIPPDTKLVSTFQSFALAMKPSRSSIRRGVGSSCLAGPGVRVTKIPSGRTS
jgi:NADPH-dependent F420 reductase